jgi:hypothetical protein
MNYQIFGEIISEYERQSKMRVRLEDHIRHMRSVSEILCEQILSDPEPVAPVANLLELSKTLAAEAMLIYEKIR